jgi:methyl-accepting chemotaxis protein
MEGARTDVDDAFRRTRLIMIGLALAALAAGIFVALRITRFIVRRLQFTVEQTRSVAQGDLTHAGEACGSADEIGELEGALSQMRLTLRELVLRIRGATEGVATASSQIASGGQDLSARSESAASSLEQTSHSIADLSGSVELTSSTALRANQLAATASDAARRGGDVMEQVVGTMGEINVASRRIADIIGVIDGIAFQTNILALNAAVESARAGEQGRGFAVVASEVRSLAQRSATAAREIKSLIDDSVGKVQSGSRQVEEAGQAMGEIVAKVGQVATMIGEISTAAQAQQSSMGEVRGAISRIDGMTQQNSALVEQSAAATANLRDQAHALAEAVRIFRVDPQVA